MCTLRSAVQIKSQTSEPIKPTRPLAAHQRLYCPAESKLLLSVRVRYHTCHGKTYFTNVPLKQHLLSSGLRSTQVRSFYGRAASGSFSGDPACEVLLLSSAHKQNEQRDKGSLCYVTSRRNGQRDTFLRLLFHGNVKISIARVEKSQRDRLECVRGIETRATV